MIKNTDKENFDDNNIIKYVTHTIDGKSIETYKKKVRLRIFLVSQDINNKTKSEYENNIIYKMALNFEKNGKLDEAENLYLVCLNNSFNLLDIFLRYAGILFKKREYNSVINVYLRAIKIFPDISDLYTNLSVTCLKVGKLDNAKAYAIKSLHLNNNSAYVNSILGSILKDQNNFVEAENYIRKSVELDPDNVNYILNLTCINRDLGDLNKAYSLCLNALRLQPDLANAHSILGIIQRDLSDFDEARTSLLKAIEIEPCNEIYYLNLSAVYVDIGDLHTAEKMIRKAISINSNSPEAHLNLGNILRDSGRIIESRYSIEKAITITPNLAMAYYALSIVSKSSFNEDLYKYLFSDEILLNQSSIGLSHVYFARSNIKHNEKNYQESESYLKKANQYKSSIYNAESESFIQKSKRLNLQLSNLQLMDSNPTIQNLNHIFIVGMPRSGSTLLESILSMNKNVFDLGEKNHLESSFNEWKDKNKFDYSLTKIYKKYINYDSHNAFISTDKWLFNYQYAGIISSLIPSARIINCFRHPLDNILSIYRANFDNRGNHFSSSIEESARVYLDQEDTILNYKSKFPSNIYLLNYDKLVLKPNEEIRKLISWLEWDWMDLYCQPHLTTRNISTASSVQARSPLNSSSLGGWKVYSELLQPAINILSSRVKYRNIGLL